MRKRSAVSKGAAGLKDLIACMRKMELMKDFCSHTELMSATAEQYATLLAKGADETSLAECRKAYAAARRDTQAALDAWREHCASHGC